MLMVVVYIYLYISGGIPHSDVSNGQQGLLREVHRHALKYLYNSCIYYNLYILTTLLML